MEGGALQHLEHLQLLLLLVAPPGLLRQLLLEAVLHRVAGAALPLQLGTRRPLAEDLLEDGGHLGRGDGGLGGPRPEHLGRGARPRLLLPRPRLLLLPDLSPPRGESLYVYCTVLYCTVLN